MDLAEVELEQPTARTREPTEGDCERVLLEVLEALTAAIADLASFVAFLVAIF